MPTLELIEHALEVGDESLLLGHVQHQAVLGDAVKVLGRVDAALVQDAGDGILEELDDDVRRPAQRDHTVLGRLHRKTRPRSKHSATQTVNVFSEGVYKIKQSCGMMKQPNAASRPG